MDEESTLKDFTIPVDDDRSVGARLYAAAGNDVGTEARTRLGATLVLAHGAGAGHLSGFMTTIARALSARGIDVLTFNFLYMEARKRVPDSNAVLEATWRRAIAATKDIAGIYGNRLIIGGKSMGGRIASQVAAQPQLLPARVDGLVFLGYPLHPPGQPDRRRDVHLAKVEAPMLFVQGERDVFGTAEEMRPLVATLRGASLYIVARGNHSLEVPKRNTPARDEVFTAVQDHIATWIAELKT